MASARSGGSGRYRRVGSGRDVDESLFGSKSPARTAGANIVSGATLKTLRDANATFLNSGDVERIRASTRIVTQDMVRQDAERAEQQRKERGERKPTDIMVETINSPGDDSWARAASASCKI